LRNRIPDLNSPTADTPAPPADPPDAPVSPAPAPRLVAEGEIRQLDPRRIPLGRAGSAIFTAIVSTLLLITAVVFWFTRGPHADTWIVSAGWFVITGLLIWMTVRWPPLEYRYWRYRLTADGIEIWSGVVWRQTIMVPKSRVQHIDVSQGPLERSYGLATLAVYTAGTEYSRVELPSLDHAVALALRDVLLPKDVEPTV
jgi:membrane protein YdbS with pleckstrin-like domain